MEVDNHQDKKVLIISYFFPPNNAIGAVRIGKFAKYLPEFGWKPIILTVKIHNDTSQTLNLEVDESNVTRTLYCNYSESVLQNLKIKGNKHHTILVSDQRNGIPSNRGNIALKFARLAKPIYSLPVIEELLLEPMGWNNYALKAGLEIIKNHRINMIFSSSTPVVSHIIASKIHKLTGIPWVAEYRDPWSNNPYFKQIQPFSLLEKLWEKRTMRNCDLFVSVSPAWVTYLERLHQKETMVITNGFDKEDYEKHVPLIPKFSITYTGNIYSGKRDPSSLFQALGELKQQATINSEKIEVRFFGHDLRESVLPIADKYGILDLVKISDTIPFKESIKKQMESTILLLLSWNNPLDAGTLTGKFLEYLGANRPILAMAYPGGEIDKLLQKSGCGILENNAEKIKEILLVWLNEFKSTGIISTHYHPDSKIINSYTRKEQSRTLAEVFNKMTI